MARAANAVLRGAAGLSRSGAFYVLDGESEVRQKFKAVRSAFEGYSALVARQADIKLARARARQIDTTLIDYHHQISALSIENGRRPRYPNNYQRDYFNGVKNQLDKLSFERNDLVREARAIRDGLPGPKEVHDLETEIGNQRESCLSVCRELRVLVDAIAEKYAGLAKDDRVRAALVEAGRASSAKPKLGPSGEYQALVRQFVAIEKDLRRRNCRPRTAARPTPVRTTG